MSDRRLDASPCLISAHRYSRPDDFHNSKWPGAGKESVGARQQARDRENQHKASITSFGSICRHHQRNRPHPKHRHAHPGHFHHPPTPNLLSETRLNLPLPPKRSGAVRSSKGFFGPISISATGHQFTKQIVPQHGASALDDSQDDSQDGGRLWTRTHRRGRPMLTTDLQRMLADGPGRQARGLQNRLRGAAEASWVGSIPIHPRHSFDRSPAIQPFAGRESALSRLLTRRLNRSTTRL